MKRSFFYFCLSFALSLFQSHAQELVPESSAMENLQTHLHKYGDCVLAKDVNKLVQFYYDMAIEDMEGEESVKELLQMAFDAFDYQQLKLESIEFSRPERFFQSGGELQASLTQTLVMKGPGGISYFKGTLIAISRNGGINWQFIDAADNSLKDLQEKFPNLHHGLEIYPQEVTTNVQLD